MVGVGLRELMSFFLEVSALIPSSEGNRFPSEEWERHEGFRENWRVPGSLSGSKANSVEVGGFGSVMLTPRGSESHALSLEQE